MFHLYLVQQFIHFWISNMMKISSSYLLSVVKQLFTLCSDIQYPKSPDWGSYMLLKLQLHAILKIRGRNNWYMFHSIWNIHCLIAFIIFFKRFFISANCTEWWWQKHITLLMVRHTNCSASHFISAWSSCAVPFQYAYQETASPITK